MARLDSEFATIRERLKTQRNATDSMKRAGRQVPEEQAPVVSADSAARVAVTIAQAVLGTVAFGLATYLSLHVPCPSKGEAYAQRIVWSFAAGLIGAAFFGRVSLHLKVGAYLGLSAVGGGALFVFVYSRDPATSFGNDDKCIEEIRQGGVSASSDPPILKEVQFRLGSRLCRYSAEADFVFHIAVQGAHGRPGGIPTALF